MTVSVIIPTFNEAVRIGPRVCTAFVHVDEVLLVVDDGSGDWGERTVKTGGAQVISQANASYITAVKRSFR